MVSEGFLGCTLGCLAGGAFEPNGAMLCLLSCYLVEIHGGGDDGDDNGDTNGDTGETDDGNDSETNGGNDAGVSEG
jgi:hypothetical protein